MDPRGGPRGRRGGLRAQRPADDRRAAAAGAAAYGGAAGVEGERRDGSAGRRPLARVVQRSRADRARHGGAGLQRRSAGGGGARRAGRRLRESGERRAVPSVGVAAIAGGKSGGGGGLDGDLAQRVARARHLGPPALRAGGGGGTVRGVRRRLRVRAPVARGDGGQELVPRDRGRAAARDRAGRGARRRTRCCGVAQDRLRIGNGNEQAVAEARASAGTYRDRLREIEQAREQACARWSSSSGRYPGAEIAVADRLSPMPAAGAGRHAVGAARAPARRRRRRAPRRCRVQSGRRSARRACFRASA